MGDIFAEHFEYAEKGLALAQRSVSCVGTVLQNLGEQLAITGCDPDTFRIFEFTNPFNIANESQFL